MCTVCHHPTILQLCIFSVTLPIFVSFSSFFIPVSIYQNNDSDSVQSVIVIQVSRCEVFNVCLRASPQWLMLLFSGLTCHSADIHFLSTLQMPFLPSTDKMKMSFWPFRETVLLLKKLCSIGIYFLLIAESTCTPRLGLFWKNRNIKKIGLRQWNLFVLHCAHRL